MRSPAAAGMMPAASGLPSSADSMAARAADVGALRAGASGGACARAQHSQSLVAAHAAAAIRRRCRQLGLGCKSKVGAKPALLPRTGACSEVRACVCGRRQDTGYYEDLDGVR